MTHVAPDLVGGLRLVGTSAAAYFTSVVLVALAVVPTALRSYQLFSRDDNGALEALVGLLRVVLVVAMIAAGRGWDVTSLVTRHEWRRLGGDIGRAVRTGWPSILIQLAVVTLVVLAFNAALEAVVDDRSVRSLLVAARLDPAPAGRAAAAVLFAVKNFVVIPLYVMAMLQSIHAVPGAPNSP